MSTKISADIKQMTHIQFISRNQPPFPHFPFWWMSIVIPLAVLFAGFNWLLEEVFHIKTFS
jgi:hypothetical protein